MTIYYEKLTDGSIGQYTNDHEVAKANNLTYSTDEKICSYDAKSYLQSEFLKYKKTDEYKQKELILAKDLRINEIKQELTELDTKRIRAMCEPSAHNEVQTWLEYYNNQAQTLREELQEIEETF